MKEEKMKRGVDVKSKLERAIEHQKKILATYETLREIINSAENPAQGATMERSQYVSVGPNR